MCFALLPLQVQDRLPHLKAIVQYKGKLSKKYPNVYEVTHTFNDIQLYIWGSLIHLLIATTIYMAEPNQKGNGGTQPRNIYMVGA